MCTSISCNINISSLQCSFLWKMFVKCLWFSFPLIPRAFSANHSSMSVSLSASLSAVSKILSISLHPIPPPLCTVPLKFQGENVAYCWGLRVSMEKGGEQEGGISLCELCLHFNSQYHACIVSVIQSVSSLKSYQRVVMNLIMIYNLSVMLLECLSVSS